MSIETMNQVVGRNVRQIRERYGITQADLASTLSNRGLRLNRTRVQDLERGNRTATIGLMFMLAFALGELSGEPIGIGDLTSCKSVEVSPGLPLSGPQLTKFLRGDPVVLTSVDLKQALSDVTEGLGSLRDQTQDIPAGLNLRDLEKLGFFDSTPTYAEERAAKRLGTSPLSVMTWARYLWGHTLDAEAKLRAANPDNAQSRGHATRQLVEQIEQAIAAQPKTPAAIVEVSPSKKTLRANDG